MINEQNYKKCSHTHIYTHTHWHVQNNVIQIKICSLRKQLPMSLCQILQNPYQAISESGNVNDHTKALSTLVKWQQNQDVKWLFWLSEMQNQSYNK